MRFCSLLVLLLLFYNLSFSQKCGIIADIKTKKSIPYTTISSLNKQKGVLADDNGKYCFELTHSQNDSIFVSSLGYELKVLSFNEYLKLDTIYLQERYIVLSEVLVKSRKIKSILTGSFHKKIRVVSDSKCMNSSAILATKIDNLKDGEKLLTKLHYRFSPKKSDFIKKFRLSCSLYNNGENNLPENNLLNKNVIIDISPTDRYAEIQIDTMNILLNLTTIWIGVQTIGYINNDNTYINISNHEFGKVVYKKNNPKKIKEVYLISPCVEMGNGNGYITKYIGSKSWNNGLINSLSPLFGITLEY